MFLSQIRISQSWVPILVSVSLLSCSLWAQDQKQKNEEAPSEPVLLDEIVARVNDQIITLRDIDRESVVIQAELRRRYENPQERNQIWLSEKKKILRQMIDTRLVLQKAEELGVAPDADVQVSTQIETLRKESGFPNLEAMEQSILQQGFSLSQLRDVLRKRYIGDQLMGSMVFSKITLLSQEIEEYYEKNLEHYSESPEVDLAEILFLTEGKQKEQVRLKAQQILVQLKAGASFNELAKEHSEGPTADKGGAIGTFKQGSMQEAQEAVVFKLQDGQFSGLIEADYGFQILKLLELKPKRQKTLEEVRADIQNQLYSQKSKPQVQKYMDTLRNESFIYVAPSYQTEYDIKDIGLTSIEY